MKLRLTWGASGEWESSHFEIGLEWGRNEAQDLSRVLEAAGLPDGIEAELVSGDALFRRTWEAVTRAVNYSSRGTWTADEALELLTLTHAIYCRTDIEQALYFAVADDGALDDYTVADAADRLDERAYNSDFDDGTVFVAASHENLGEAYWSLFNQAVLYRTPGWFDRTISKEAAIDVMADRSDRCYPIESGGKWYVTCPREDFDAW